MPLSNQQEQIGLLRERVARLETSQEHHGSQIEKHASLMSRLQHQVEALVSMIHSRPLSQGHWQRAEVAKIVLSALIPIMSFLLVYLLTGSLEAARQAAKVVAP